MDKPKSFDRVLRPYTANASYYKEELTITRAEGYFVFDNKGKRYIDGIAGLWNVNAGHGRQRIVDAINKQLKELDFFPILGSSNIPSTKLAELLVGISPTGPGLVFYSHSGTEANETAIKLSRHYHRLTGNPEKTKTISFENGWHGGTIGSLSLTAIESETKDYGPLLEAYHLKPTFKNADTTGALVGQMESFDLSKVCAIFVEPFIGVGGFYPLPLGYVKKLRELCDEHNILLIADEVATGFGRTGKMFGIEHYGIVPDLVTIAKGVTSGYLPLSATIVSDRVAEPFLQEGVFLNHGYSTQGHPACCTAAIENIQIMLEEDLVGNSKKMGCYLKEQLEKLRRFQILKDIRGLGLMFAIEFKSSQKTDAVCAEAKKRGIILRNLDNILPLMPPLNIDKQGIDAIAGILSESILHVEREMGGL